ncbi:hypothetical protein SELMODRAFT_421903 [Selaginella moellendorffii]|uniref:DIRP domain-containing protein n=1 Tax=Selaginella moellendorffii TaxID=88036 RepID=D8SGQ0_SELML|nr:protein ALWAYS EARLY 3 [Selaginella moellendorffii]XP_024543287.1 protein ALWAYS EARLY 3 [Selaginella moellendorffii]EFJ16240.1 hypothetical protein SELMODRAFT_421903 [Selaginella moellendorffii]|eukprot:XP_002982487.1 protein ALWAYS EARLY 3 [Selaginella moellendorffii]
MKTRRNKSVSARQASTANGGKAALGGPSPAKKPRTNRPRVAGNKIPHFLLEEAKTKNGKSVDDDNSDDYDFNNVVKAVALTLAEASQNGSESESPTPPKAKENGKATRARPSEPDTTSTGDKNNGRRPPSKRIRNRRESRENLEEEREGSDMGVVEDSKPQKTRFLPQRSKKRSRQLFSSGDEISGLDALATLADLSLSGLLPSPTNEAGGDGTAPEQQKLQDLVTQVLRSERGSVKKEQREEGRAKEQSNKKQPSASPDAKRKKKRTEKSEAGTSTKPDDKALPFVYKPHGRTKRISTSKLHRHSRHDGFDESAQDGDFEPRSKRKHTSEKETRTYCPHTTAEFGPSSAKARLLHCLSIPRVRQWCVYEWFYSAIDLPWFARNEFVEYLNHAGLGHVSKLTRTEWTVIRSSLGKPRRLSQKFLQVEREKLEAYRDTVRAHYHDIRNDKSGCCLPPDLARPLTVGQRVIARHPKNGEIHDGRILTVDRNRCRVQFERTELGVEFVLDINAMPVNPLENMSDIMRKRRIIDLSSSGHRIGAGNTRNALNDRLDRPYATPSQYFLSTLSHRAQMDNVDSVLLAKAAANEAVAAVQQGQPSSSIQAQAREADICALAELSRQLDKKEALLVELRRMNDEADRSAGEAESLRNSEAFKIQYATVVLQLKNVNKQVSAAVVQLRERNRYQENLVAPWHSPPCAAVDGAVAGLGAGSPAEEISLTTRKDARSMVSAFVQAVCCLKEGEDALSRLGKQHNYVDGQPAKEGGAGTGTGLGFGSSPPANHHQSQGSDKSQTLPQDTQATSQVPTAPYPPDIDAYIPAEFIASCLTTLLMIKTCTERQLPPSDVAVMFENVLENLRPHNATNHQIYKEVEQCFDVLKNQVTAQVSIRSNISLPVDCHLQ